MKIREGTLKLASFLAYYTTYRRRKSVWVPSFRVAESPPLPLPLPRLPIKSAHDKGGKEGRTAQKIYEQLLRPCVREGRKRYTL